MMKINFMLKSTLGRFSGRLAYKKQKKCSVSYLYNPFRHISCKNYTAPFEDDEVYDGHRQDRDKWDGPILVPENATEFLIIGGGIMGHALAYNLWKMVETLTPMKPNKNLGNCNIVVVEKDPTMKESCTALSVGGIRTQFSNQANVKLSLDSADFLRKIKMHLSTVRNQDPDIQFNPQGYLTLATTNGADQLMKNYQTQVDAGAKVMVFDQKRLKETFPWLNVDEIELATYGLENEGWFDPMSLLNSFKHKNTSFPIHTITGEVVGFKKEKLFSSSEDEPVTIESYDGSITEVNERLDGVYVQTKDHDKPVYIKCSQMFNCAGPLSSKVAELAGIGSNDENAPPILKHKLPVEKRKRYVYVVHCPDAPLFDCPFLVDPSGVYVRREGFGGKYVCGMSPTEEQEPSTDNLDVDEDFFYEEVWPRLAHRIPAFENLKLTSSWAGYYDYNTFDQNGIIGHHPYYTDMFFLTGFSGHGIQQSCAAAAGLAKLAVKGVGKRTRIYDLEPFSFNRIIINKPLVESNII